jgi:NitT/TauT family transport system permease protein
MIWFHLTHYAAGFIIFIGAFFPILIDSYTGFRDVPKVLVETGKVLGCIEDKKQIKYVAFPYALPSIATGTLFRHFVEDKLFKWKKGIVK